MDNLQREFGGLKADNFYLGVRMRGEVQRLNETLLRYRLRGDTNDAEAFRTDARAFARWLNQTGANRTTPFERQFFGQMMEAYNEYLADCAPVLEDSRGRMQSTQALKFKSSYEKVQSQSRRLLTLCDSFMRDQRASFSNLLRETNDALSTFSQMLRLLLGLMLALTLAVVLLIYRGLVTPLRHELTETHTLMARQEKLASLGALAAGVAHEIRNPLTAIKLRLYSLKRHLPSAGPDNDDAAVITAEITRLERIVRDFLQFARPSEPELVATPAQRIVDEVQGLLEPQLNKSAIQMKVEATEAAWVRVDTQQIKQVLINLVQNSADSIGRRGLITIRIHKGPRMAPGGDGESVIVEVADNGKGIPPEVRKRLFDPFFTTKEGGTGLGLPIAARIVEKHGGEIRYHTEPRRGTTFSVILPSAHEPETEHSTHRG
jgi:signal transduction histidine kinase